MAFSTKECAWAQTTIKLLGRTLVGIKAFEFDKEIEKERLFGAGQTAFDILEGNKNVDGSITLYKYEVDMLNDAALAAGYPDISEVPWTLIVVTCAFQLTKGARLRTITIPGLGFTKMSFGMKQNDKGMEVQLPFVATQMLLV